MEPMQNFVVYKSSAGSGKTYTLVKEYLKIVLRDPGKIRNILAITFTNAAAAEMKERIIAALGDLAALTGLTESNRPQKSNALLQDLKKETGLDSSEIIRNSQFALTLILHNYGEFSVSTIDSFAHRIIRSFAFDLHLPINFDVELDQDQMLSQAIDLLVSRAGSEPALTQLLIEYIESRTDEERSHYIEYDMARLARTLMDEKGTVYIERLKGITLDDFSNIHKKLNNSIREFEETVSAVAMKARQLIDEQSIPDEMFYRGKQGIGGYFANLAKGLVADKINPNSYVRTTIADDKWMAAKASSTIVSAIESIKPFLTDHFNQIQSLSDNKLGIYKIHKLVKKHLFPMAVLCELEKVMNEIKSENAVIHISDFNKKIAEVVSVEPAPFIYERIGERYHHFMIDEFQDTSGLQWQNLLPLIDNSLASGHINLVVGDGKQAIYRWRNGDVEQFASLPNLPENVSAQSKVLWQQTLTRNYHEKYLKANWRSLPGIIDFNNNFFEFAQSYLPPELAAIYNGLCQDKHPEKTGGYVQIDFVGKQPDDNLDYTAHTHLKILEIIKDLLDGQHPLNDITLLCRSNGEASAIARFLLENGLNVISSESLLLSQSPKVNFMISTMKLINHGDDEISMTEFLSFLVKNKIIEGNLHEILAGIKANQGRPSDNYNSRKPHHILTSLEKILRDYGINFSFVHGRHLGLYELGETIIRNFFDTRLPDPFIAFFMDVLYEYSNRFVSSLSDFLEWWQENSAKHSVVVPEGIDAVQVMTIHKSKGLQFPVVIYPFVDKDFSRPGKEGEWVELGEMDETHPLTIAWLSISSAMEGTQYEDIWTREMGKTLLDMLNVVYVAFTRAIEKLFILTKIPESGKFSEKNLAGILQKYLEIQGLWSHDLLTYSYGENSMNVKETVSDSPNIGAKDCFQEYISTPWAQKISIRSRQLEINEDRSSASERGSRIHEIMEQIHSSEDIAAVMQQLIFTGQADKEEANLLEERIMSILMHPSISKYYSKGLYAKNECGMYDWDGKFYRADRVILDDNHAIIIDYKTGQPMPDHSRQINNYAEIISAMGYSNVKKFIVYLDQAEVVEIA
jgi:ATP-dependent exoDNAse (exonuclease V) beta subunit